MPSEFAPGWSKPRMTNVQIRKLQREQEEARRIAEAKLIAAKKSDEWKKEQKILNSLENVLEDEKLIVTWKSENISEEKIQKKELNFLEKVIQFIKKLFN